jgi:plasmid maintenance system antidote protein VapI
MSNSSSDNNNSSFLPDWVSPPGDTIVSCMQEKNLKNFETAKLLKLELSFFERLLVGKERINKVIADRLETCFGSSSKFWLKREENYRSELKRLKKEKTMKRNEAASETAEKENQE